MPAGVGCAAGISWVSLALGVPAVGADGLACTPGANRRVGPMELGGSSNGLPLRQGGHRPSSACLAASSGVGPSHWVRLQAPSPPGGTPSSTMGKPGCVVPAVSGNVHAPLSTSLARSSSGMDSFDGCLSGLARPSAPLGGPPVCTLACRRGMVPQPPGPGRHSGSPAFGRFACAWRVRNAWTPWSYPSVRKVLPGTPDGGKAQPGVRLTAGPPPPPWAATGGNPIGLNPMSHTWVYKCAGMGSSVW